jgi:hypothetical protein
MWGALNEGNKSTSPISPAFHLLAGGTKEKVPKSALLNLYIVLTFLVFLSLAASLPLQCASVHLEFHSWQRRCWKQLRANFSSRCSRRFAARTPERIPNLWSRVNQGMVAAQIRPPPPPPPHTLARH